MVGNLSLTSVALTIGSRLEVSGGLTLGLQSLLNFTEAAVLVVNGTISSLLTPLHTTGLTLL